MKRSTMMLVAMGVAMGWAGCGGSDPCSASDNGDGTITLSCPGSDDVVIRNGMDGVDGSNGMDGTDGTNGMDGADGTSYVIRTAIEAAGANCAEGGIAVEVGPDTNGNGALDDEEVSSTEYVCNGANGADGLAGADGVSHLVATADEPAGPNCADGGIVVTSGPDTDGSGSLDAGEVTATRYVCDGADGVGGGGGGAVTLDFPSSTSSLDNTFSSMPLGAGGGGVAFRTGSSVEQAFTGTGAATISSLFYQFDMDDQTNSSCSVGTLTFDVIINGTTVDTYSFVGGSSMGRTTFTGEAHFLPIAGTGAGGDDYTLRLEANETVCGGGGSYNWYSGGAFIANP